MPEPLTEIDDLVRKALTEFSGLTALVPLSDIQLWDRAVDVREDPEEPIPEMRGRVWIIPLPGVFDTQYSPGEVRHERHYQIGFGAGSRQLSQCRAIERQIQKAMSRLCRKKQANGLAAIVEPTGFSIDSIATGRTDPDRDPIADPEEWRDVCELHIIAHESWTNVFS